jgi:hypothetical protein
MYTRIAFGQFTASSPSLSTCNMGKKAKTSAGKNATTSDIEKDMANKTMKDNRKKSEDRSSFVCCQSCCFCDTASFERTDEAAYRAHLRTEHGVTRNIEALLHLSNQLLPGI